MMSDWNDNTFKRISAALARFVEDNHDWSVSARYDKRLGVLIITDGGASEEEMEKIAEGSLEKGSKSDTRKLDKIKKIIEEE